MFDGNELDMMDEIISSVEAKSRNFEGVFSLKPGEKKHIRFLHEGKSGLMFIKHGRFVKGDARAGWSVPCPLSFDKFNSNRGKEKYHKRNCPYCQFLDDENGTKSEQMAAWLIWNLTDGLTQAFVYKPDSDKGPIPDLVELYARKRTIMDRTFIITKGNEASFPATKLSWEDPEDFIPPKGCIIPKNNSEAQKSILKLIAQAWCPALLSSGSEFYLPPHHQPNAVEKSKQSIDDMFTPEVDEEESDDEALPGEEAEVDFEDLAGLE